MGLETGTFTDDLVITNPPGTDDKRQGDDHLRLIKSVLRNTFKRGSKAFFLPGVVTKSANYVVQDTDENLTIVCDTTAGAFTLTLPTLDSTRLGWTINVVKSNLQPNPVFIAPASGTINGYSKIRRTIENTITEVEWVGFWVASRPNGGAPVGSTISYYGSTLPNGHLWADGNGFTATDFVELNSVLGAALTPDVRERAQFGRDNLGNVDRLVSGISGVNGNLLGAVGGSGVVSLTVPNLPPYTPTGSVSSSGTCLPQGSISVVDSGHAHTYNSGTTNAVGFQPGGAGLNYVDTPLGNLFTTNTGFANISASFSPITTALSVFSTFNGNPQGGSAAAFTNVPPAIVCNMVVVAE